MAAYGHGCQPQDGAYQSDATNRGASRSRSGVGPLANLSEAVRNAVWKAFAGDAVAELRAAFSQLDESEDAAPAGAEIASEIRAWWAQR
jgi:hypothetical protein